MSTVAAQNFKDPATAKSVDAAYVTDGTAKAWVSFTNAAVLESSLNVSSMTDGAPTKTVSYTNSFTSGTGYIGLCNNDQVANFQNVTSKSTSGCSLSAYGHDGTSKDDGGDFVAYGDLA